MIHYRSISQPPKSSSTLTKSSSKVQYLPCSYVYPFTSSYSSTSASMPTLNQPTFTDQPRFQSNLPMRKLSKLSNLCWVSSVSQPDLTVTTPTPTMSPASSLPTSRASSPVPPSISARGSTGYLPSPNISPLGSGNVYINENGSRGSKQNIQLGSTNNYMDTAQVIYTASLLLNNNGVVTNSPYSSNNSLSQHGGSGQNLSQYGGGSMHNMSQLDSSQLKNSYYHQGQAINQAIHEGPASSDMSRQSSPSHQNMAPNGQAHGFLQPEINLNNQSLPSVNGSAGTVHPTFLHLDGSAQHGGNGINQGNSSGQWMPPFGNMVINSNPSVDGYQSHDGGGMNHPGYPNQSYQTSDHSQNFPQGRIIPQNLYQIGSSVPSQPAIGAHSLSYCVNGQTIIPFTYLNSAIPQAAMDHGTQQPHHEQLNHNHGEQAAYSSNLLHANNASNMPNYFSPDGNLYVDHNHPNLVYRVLRQDTSPAKQLQDANKPCAIISPNQQQAGSGRSSTPAWSPDIEKAKTASNSREGTSSPETRDVGTSCHDLDPEPRAIPFMVETCQICNLFTGSTSEQHTCKPSSYYSYAPCLYGDKVVEINEGQSVASGAEQKSKQSQALQRKRLVNFARRFLQRSIILL